MTWTAGGSDGAGGGSSPVVSPGGQCDSVQASLNSIQMLAIKVENMDISQHEFAYLRLCTLFKFSKSNFLLWPFLIFLFFSDQPTDALRKLTDPIFERVLTSFRSYYDSSHHSHGSGRLGKILLTNIYIESCEHNHLEQLFFTGIMGGINIDSVIPYILSMRIPHMESA